MRNYHTLPLVLVLLIALGCTRQTVAPTLPAALPKPALKTGTLRFFDQSNIDVRDVPILLVLDDLKAQGYDVQVTYLAEPSLVVAGLERGDADIAAVNNQTMWAAIAKGVNARTIAESIGPTAIVVADQKIKTCLDLDGKRVAVPSATTLTAKLLTEYLRQNCPNAKPEILLVQANDARNAGLVKGELDAALVQGEALLNLERDAPGKFHTLVSIPKEFPKVRVDGFHVRRQWAEQNPELVKAFLRAVLLANRRVNENPDVLVYEAEMRVKLDTRTAKQIGDTYLQLNVWDPNGGLSTEKVQSTLDLFIQLNFLPSGLKVGDVADLSYLNAVLDEMGRK